MPEPSFRQLYARNFPGGSPVSQCTGRDRNPAQQRLSVEESLRLAGRRPRCRLGARGGVGHFQFLHNRQTFLFGEALRPCVRPWTDATRRQARPLRVAWSLGGHCLTRFSRAGRRCQAAAETRRTTLPPRVSPSAFCNYDGPLRASCLPAAQSALHRPRGRNGR